MAKVPPLTSHGPMVILARNSPVVANFDELSFYLLLLLLNFGVGILERFDQGLYTFNLLLMIKSQLN